MGIVFILGVVRTTRRSSGVGMTVVRIVGVRMLGLMVRRGMIDRGTTVRVVMMGLNVRTGTDRIMVVSGIVHLVLHFSGGPLKFCLLLQSVLHVVKPTQVFVIGLLEVVIIVVRQVIG